MGSLKSYNPKQIHEKAQKANRHVVTFKQKMGGTRKKYEEIVAFTIELDRKVKRDIELLTRKKQEVFAKTFKWFRIIVPVACSVENKQDQAYIVNKVFNAYLG
jgi:hypothetical protein